MSHIEIESQVEFLLFHDFLYLDFSPEMVVKIFTGSMSRSDVYAFPEWDEAG